MHKAPKGAYDPLSSVGKAIGLATLRCGLAFFSVV